MEGCTLHNKDMLVLNLAMKAGYKLREIRKLVKGGCDAYNYKPISIDSFIDTVQSFWTKRPKATL